MRKTSRAEKICTVCEKVGDIGDSVKGSSSRMKNKVGAQKGAFIKMKRENMYVYQWLCGLCYVPIIAAMVNSGYSGIAACSCKAQTGTKPEQFQRTVINSKLMTLPTSLNPPETDCSYAFKSDVWIYKPRKQVNSGKRTCTQRRLCQRFAHAPKGTRAS